MHDLIHICYYLSGTLGNTQTYVFWTWFQALKPEFGQIE